MRTKLNRKTSNIFVEYRDNVSSTSPLEGRTYTMTHSDETGDLFVTIGLSYATDKISQNQDQVYLKWMPIEDKYYLYGEVIIDGNNVLGNPEKRNEIFKREMPLALRAIYTADLPFFIEYTVLNDTPVLINFQSSTPKYDKLYDYGLIGNYSPSSSV